MDEIKFLQKKALVRVDFNVPLNDKLEVTDDTRIAAALPTLKYILDEGGALILMSHLGRPQKKLKEDGSIDVDRFTLANIIPALTENLGVQIKFASDCGGPIASEMAANLQAGEVLLLENTRFNKEEAAGDTIFAQSLAELGDVYINDAFGTAHRAHASTTTVANFSSQMKKLLVF